MNCSYRLPKGPVTLACTAEAIVVYPLIDTRTFAPTVATQYIYRCEHHPLVFADHALEPDLTLVSKLTRMALTR